MSRRSDFIHNATVKLPDSFKPRYSPTQSDTCIFSCNVQALDPRGKRILLLKELRKPMTQRNSKEIGNICEQIVEWHTKNHSPASRYSELQNELGGYTKNPSRSLWDFNHDQLAPLEVKTSIKNWKFKYTAQSNFQHLDIPINLRPGQKGSLIRTASAFNKRPRFIIVQLTPMDSSVPIARQTWLIRMYACPSTRVTGYQ